MNVDTMLRESLHTRADEAPPNAGLLDAVRDRAHRHRWHRQLVVAGGVVAAVAVAGPIAVVQATGGDPAPRDEVGGGQPSTATELVAPADLGLPDFPFTPGWVPSGTETFYDFQEFGLVSLSQRDPAGTSVLWADVNLEDPDHALRGIDKLREQAEGYGGTAVDETVTVHGREAVLTRTTEPGTADEDEAPRDPSRLAAVTWLHEPGQRVAVFGDSADDVLRFAQELTEEPFPAQTPFTFDLMPPGAQLDATQPNLMMFGPAAFTPGSEINAVQVELLRGGPGMTINCPLVNPESATGACVLPREPVQVGAHDGELVGNDMVIVYLEDGLAISVAAAGSLALSDDDLLRFAAGVQVTEYATPTPSD